MKAKMITVMSVVLVGLAALLLLAQWAAAMSDTPTSPQAALPQPTPTPLVHVLSYQGQVRVNGSPYNGSGYFKFAIVNAAADITYWSNDDTSSGGAEPASAVPLVVSNGLFNVLLGDSSVPNMTSPLIAEVFSYGDTYLRTWFSSDSFTFTQLIPDRRIGSAPTAMRAEQAANADLLEGQRAGDFWQLTGNAGTDPNTHFLGTSDNKALVLKANGAERLRVGSGSSVTVGDGASSTDLLLPLGGMCIDSDGACTSPGDGGLRVGATGIHGTDSSGQNVYLAPSSGKVGIGTNTPSERLTVRGNGLILGEDNPVARGFITTTLDGPSWVFVSGKYAYVVCSSVHRLAIFDVSDPDSIVARGYTETNLNYPESVCVCGKYAYVASRGNNRLAIFDISDPDNIVAKDYTSAGLNRPRSVRVSGKYAYLVSENGYRLSIFDVSDPDNIVARGYTSENLTYPRSVYVCGKYAYVASGSASRLAIFDVSDPDNIVAKDYTTTNLSFAYSVYVSGRFAYVASLLNDRLAIFDVSDPDSIVPRGYASDNLDGPVSVYVSGKYAYVASRDNSRLAVFDVSDPDSIVAKGYTAANLDSPERVYVSGQYGYVASNGNDRLAIFEFNHLESPTLETGNLQSGYLDVTDNAIVGNNLYVQGGLNVGPGGALIGGDLGVEGHLQVRGEYIQFPTISGGEPPAEDCNQPKEYGRVVVRTDGTVNLYVCTASGWVGK